MPNTPCLIGQAASAFVMGTHATESDANKAYALMSSVGELALPVSSWDWLWPRCSLTSGRLQYSTYAGKLFTMGIFGAHYPVRVMYKAVYNCLYACMATALMGWPSS